MTEDFLLVLGYYPDQLADHGLPPDHFFMYCTVADTGCPVKQRAAERMTILQTMEYLCDACVDKYKLAALDPWDCFWYVSPRPKEPSPS